MAELSAIDAGYPQSDKESFETTYWTQHNIYVEGFLKAMELYRTTPPEVGAGYSDAFDNGVTSAINHTSSNGTIMVLYDLIKADKETFINSLNK